MRKASRGSGGAAGSLGRAGPGDGGWNAKELGEFPAPCGPIRMGRIGASSRAWPGRQNRTAVKICWEAVFTQSRTWGG